MQPRRRLFWAFIAAAGSGWAGAAAAASEVPVVGPLIDAVSSSDNIAIIVLTLVCCGLLWVVRTGWLVSRDRQAAYDASTAETRKLYVDTMREAAAAAAGMSKALDGFRAEVALGLEKVRNEIERLREDEARNSAEVRQEIARLSGDMRGQSPPARRKAD